MVFDVKLFRIPTRVLRFQLQINIADSVVENLIELKRKESWLNNHLLQSPVEGSVVTVTIKKFKMGSENRTGTAGL
jgi:hypothetical protein